METGMTTRRLQRLVRQQLESLQRAGVTELARHVPISSIAAPELAPQLASVLATDLAPEPAPPATHAVSASAAPPARYTRVDKPHVLVNGGHGQDQEMANSATRVLHQRLTELAVIQAEVAGCRRCEDLACARTQTVFGVGSATTRLCFLGEAPGADEDRTGEPFVGRAGQLLTDIIKAMGLQRADVYILNVLKCRPPNNRPPTEEEVGNCHEYLERQLKVLRPEFICCLGATAVRALLNKTQALGRLRGQWFEYCGARVIVTYHPSYLLRNPAAKKDTWKDVQLMMREMGLSKPQSG